MRRLDLLGIKERDDFRASEVMAVNIGNYVWVGTGKKKKAARFIQTDHRALEIGPADRILGVVVGLLRPKVTRNR